MLARCNGSGDLICKLFHVSRVHQGVNEVCSRVMKKSTSLEVATPSGTIIVNLRSGFPAPYKCGVNVALQTQHKVGCSGSVVFQPLACPGVREWHSFSVTALHCGCTYRSFPRH